MSIENFQSEHLFLLVGTNPLPDWVAARLLLKDGGQLYLLCSRQTEPIAKRLAKYLVEHNNCKQPEYVTVNNPYRAGDVFSAVKVRVSSIKSGRVGLNYTGGTKVMTTHGYRSVEQSLPQGLPQPVFSYLEAANCVMHFDPPHEQEINVGLFTEVSIKIGQLRELHGSDNVAVPRKQPQAIAAAQLLGKHHSKGYQAQKAWRDKMDTLPKVSGKFKEGSLLSSAKLAVSDDFPDVLKELSQTNGPQPPTLDDIALDPRWQFQKATAVAEWLDGKWLEHLVLHHLLKHQNEFKLNDIASNVKKSRSSFSDEYELDVVAMRGYQLHVISCYTGSDKTRAKMKLFEAISRAKQLGGEAARAAIVCCSDNPDWVQNEVGEIFDNPNQFEVFGRKHLLRLGDYLAQWFAKGAQ